MGLFVEEFAHSVLYGGHAGHAAHHDHLVDIGWFEVGIVQRLLHRFHGALDEFVGQLLQF